MMSNTERKPMQTQGDARIKEIPLLESHFHKLGVSTRGDRQQIVEAAEEKSLTLDGEICSKARSDLTNPRNRLAAELAWLPGLSPRRCEQLLQALVQNPGTLFDVEGIDPLARANLMSSAIRTISPSLSIGDLHDRVLLFSEAIDEIEPETVRAIINADRVAAGFPEVKSEDIVREGLIERRGEFKESLRLLMNDMPAADLARLVSEISETATINGTMLPSPLIDDMVDAYAVGVHSFLVTESENIQTLIERIRQAALTGADAVKPILDRLEKVVANWRFVAHPIQVLASAKGASHEPSRDLAQELRSLGIDLYNQHEMIGSSQRIIALIGDAFGTVAEVAERAGEDAQALDDIAQRKAVDTKVKPFHDLCTKTMEQVDAEPFTGESEGQKMLAKGSDLIKRFKADGVNPQIIFELEDILAICLMRCAIAHGNYTDKWSGVLNLLETAEKLVHDKDVAQRIAQNQQIARNNIRLFDGLTPIDSAPSLRTINGFGFTLYFPTDQDQASGSCLMTYYFVALAIPIFPICRYRVIPSSAGYRFLGKASLRTFDKWHLAASVLGIIYLFAKG